MKNGVTNLYRWQKIENKENLDIFIRFISEYL